MTSRQVWTFEIRTDQTHPLIAIEFSNCSSTGERDGTQFFFFLEWIQLQFG